MQTAGHTDTTHSIKSSNMLHCGNRSWPRPCSEACSGQLQRPTEHQRAYCLLSMSFPRFLEHQKVARSYRIDEMADRARLPRKQKRQPNIASVLTLPGAEVRKKEARPLAQVNETYSPCHPHSLTVSDQAYRLSGWPSLFLDKCIQPTAVGTRQATTHVLVSTHLMNAPLVRRLHTTVHELCSPHYRAPAA